MNEFTMQWVRRVGIYFALLATVACESSPTGPGGTEQGFVTNGNVELRWFLDLPSGEGPFPAVVYGQGSGSITANFPSTIANSRELNRLGFAVMRYDKRGTGRSTGELQGVSLANSQTSIPVLASDMQAVLDRMLADPRIDTQRIGLFGVSQANWYMPVVAEATPEVRFMVVVTGGVLPVGFQLRYEELKHVDGLSKEEAEAELGLLSDFDGPLGFNAIPIIKDLDIPMLHLLGGNDQLGPLQANLVVIEELIAGAADLEAMVYDGADHGLPGVDFWPDLGNWLQSIW